MRLRFVLSFLVLFGLAQSPFAAESADVQFIASEPLQLKRATQTYIVQLRENPISSYTGGINGIAPTKPASGDKIDLDAANVRQYFSHLGAMQDRVLADVGVSEKVHGYAYSFNGFAAELTQAQLESLMRHDEVVRIWQDELLQPQTNATPRYLGLSGNGGPWSEGLTGEDVIVGIIDSGVWPEHPSFADVPTREFGNQGPLVPYGPPPASWNGGECDFGNAAYNPLDAPFTCNNKLLGARTYAEGFLSASALLPEEYLSARDQDGHGSHVGATAAGNARVEASIAGEDLDKVSGMAPRARVAVYKVCWNGSFPPPGFQGGCFSSDSMAAIDQAVADGVDVINFSIGGPSTSFSGPDDIAFLFAADAGVFVAAAQGNSGPDPQTTGTPAGVPWLTSVGASADSKVFNLGAEVTSADPGASGIYEAVEAAISVPLETSGDVISNLVLVDDGSGATGNEGCGPLVNGAAVAGNVALISRGTCAFSIKILNAQAAGAVGVIVYSNDGNPIIMGGDPTGITLPAVMIGQSDGEAVAASIAGGDAATATLSESIQISKNFTVASFSSRGPNGGAPDIIKPDIVAPGVNILAAQTPTPNDGQAPGELFQIIGGTSMASPHIAGVAALLRQAHPDWSPEAVRSAMMTTARLGMKKSFGNERASPFDVGAGLVDARKALDPGLVFETNLLDYIRFLCAEPLQSGIVPDSLCGVFPPLDQSDLNLPSIGVADLVGQQTVTRTVRSVLEEPATFDANVWKPRGVDVQVSPGTITLNPGETRTFEVNFSTSSAAQIDNWTFGGVKWTEQRDDKQKPISVFSRVAVKPVAAAFPGEVSEPFASADGGTSFDIQAGLDGDLATSAAGLTPAIVQEDQVAIGGATLHFFFVPPGTRLTSVALFDESVGDGTGVDDLDLQVQGPDSLGFPFVDFSGSPTSEEQIDLVDPLPGLYAAFVIHFASVAPVTEYDLHDWSVGPNLGNVTVTPGGPVSAGDVVPTDVDWSGLAPNTKYRGLVEVSLNGGSVGFTVLSIDTAP